MPAVDVVDIAYGGGGSIIALNKIVSAGTNRVELQVLVQVVKSIVQNGDFDPVPFGDIPGGNGIDVHGDELGRIAQMPGIARPGIGAASGPGGSEIVVVGNELRSETCEGKQWFGGENAGQLGERFHAGEGVQRAFEFDHDQVLGITHTIGSGCSHGTGQRGHTDGGGNGNHDLAAE